MALKLTIQAVLAGAMIAVVHAFMLYLEVPRPAAWYLGAIIYAGLVAVLFSNAAILDKLGTYGLVAVVTIVGANTVCPCTGAHFFLAPLAGFAFLGLLKGIKLVTIKSPPPHEPTDPAT